MYKITVFQPVSTISNKKTTGYVLNAGCNSNIVPARLNKTYHFA